MKARRTINPDPRQNDLFAAGGGKVCPRCGVFRLVSEFGPNRARKDRMAVYCRPCTKEYVKPKQYDRSRYLKNGEAERQRSALYRQRNLDVLRLRDRRTSKEWRDKNPAKKRVQNIARKHRQTRATPPWADLDAMNAIYTEARRLQEADGIERHVDHVIPLKHPLVCGLHVSTNLRITTATENMQKRNKFNVAD